MSTDPLHALSTPTTGGFREVAPARAALHLDAVHVVDVREADEWVGPLGHIGSAEHVPLATVLIGAAAWDRSAPLLLVCRSGARSGRAATALAQAGFTHLYNLTGGMMAWNEAGLPVTRH